jgi:uncharacterized protein YjbI with pentapeptide repeats
MRIRKLIFYTALVAVVVTSRGCLNQPEPIVKMLFPYPPDTSISFKRIDYMNPEEVAGIIASKSFFANGQLRNEGIAHIPMHGDDFRGHVLDDIYWTDIVACHSDFRGTIFRYAVAKGGYFDSCDFRVADLRWTNFSHSVLTNCDFKQARMFRVLADEADFSNSEMMGANMFGFEGNNTVLRNCNFSNALLKESELIDADFTGSTAIKTNFLLSVLFNVKADSADFSYSDFTGASLEGASFVHSRFINTNFQGAHLQGADFTGADLSGCSFFGAEFENTLMQGAINIPPDIEKLLIDGVITAYYISDNDKPQ